jgi:glycosyltransferase involved in cell wall biosynthesis
MKISIITVTYNSSETIIDTLNSIKEQSFRNIEYIIIDGNSKDNTLSIISEYDHIISKVVTEPDAGIYDAMNKGIKLATGDIIGILNSDDIYDNSNVIESVIQVFESDNAIDAVYGNLSYFRTAQPTKIVRFWKSLPFYDNFFEDGYVIPHPTLFVKRQVYEKIGLYFPDFKISSDYELMLRAFKINQFKPFYLNKNLVKMRMGGTTTKNIQNIILGNQEIYKAWRMNNLSTPLFFYLKRFMFKIKQLHKS